MSVQSFIETARTVLIDPNTAFTQMRREGGLVPPLIYFLIGMLIGVVGSMVWQMFGLGMGAGMGGFGGATAPFAGTGMLIIVPVCATIGIFVGSAIIHFALGLFGGQKFSYETTFRVMAYAIGSSYPIGLIPICGGLIGAVWGIVVAVIGMSQAQETTIGKAAAAVLTPTVICCALLFIFSAMIAALIFGAAASSGFGR